MIWYISWYKLNLGFCRFKILTVREQQAVCYYQREVSVLEILPMNQKYRSHASQTSSNRGYA